MEGWELVLILLYAIACVILLKRYLKKERFESPFGWNLDSGSTPAGTSPPRGTTPAGTTPAGTTPVGTYTVTTSDKPGVTLKSNAFTKGTNSGGVDVNVLTGDVTWKSASLVQPTFTPAPGMFKKSNSGYQAVMQPDGNFVILDSAKTVLWSTETTGKGKTATLWKDGNFLVADSKNKVIWASNTINKGTAPYKAVMQEDGNFVVSDSKNKALWSSGTAGKGKGTKPPSVGILQTDFPVMKGPNPPQAYQVTGTFSTDSKVPIQLRIPGVYLDNTLNVVKTTLILPANNEPKKFLFNCQITDPYATTFYFGFVYAQPMAAGVKNFTVKVGNDIKITLIKGDPTPDLSYKVTPTEKTGVTLRSNAFTKGLQTGGLKVDNLSGDVMWKSVSLVPGSIDKLGGRLETDYQVVRGPNSPQVFQVTGTFSTDSKVPIQLRIPGIFVTDTFSRADTKMFIPENNVPKKFLFNCNITEPVDRFYFGFVYAQPMAAGVKNFTVKVGNDIKITLIQGDPTPVAPPLYPPVTATSKTYTIKSASRKLKRDPSMFFNVFAEKIPFIGTDPSKPESHWEFKPVLGTSDTYIIENVLLKGKGLAALVMSDSSTVSQPPPVMIDKTITTTVGVYFTNNQETSRSYANKKEQKIDFVEVLFGNDPNNPACQWILKPVK